MTTREPEWDEHSQAEMLALARYRDLTCKGCGGWLPETTDIEAEDTYVAELVRCHRCTAFDIGATRARELTHPSSLLLQVDRRE